MFFEYVWNPSLFHISHFSRHNLNGQGPAYNLSHLSRPYDPNGPL